MDEQLTPLFFLVAHPDNPHLFPSLSAPSYARHSFLGVFSKTEAER